MSLSACQLGWTPPAASWGPRAARCAAAQHRLHWAACEGFYRSQLERLAPAVTLVAQGGTQGGPTSAAGPGLSALAPMASVEVELQHTLDRKRCAVAQRASLPASPAPAPDRPPEPRLPACRGELQQVAVKAGTAWLAPTAATEAGTEQVGGWGGGRRRAARRSRRGAAHVWHRVRGLLQPLVTLLRGERGGRGAGRHETCARKPCPSGDVRPISGVHRAVTCCAGPGAGKHAGSSILT